MKKLILLFCLGAVIGFGLIFRNAAQAHENSWALSFPTAIGEQWIATYGTSLLTRVLTTTPERPETIFISLVDVSTLTPLPPRYTFDDGEAWLFNPQYNLAFPLAGIIPKDDPLSPLRLFANTAYGLFRSGDLGLSWASTEQTAFEFAISPMDPQILYTTYWYWGGTGGFC